MIVRERAGRGAGWGRAVASLAGARPEPFWTSQPGAPDPAPALTGAIAADTEPARQLRTERTGLAMVRSRPVPFPPEPARSAVIQLTRASLARADRDAGRRNLWLRTLDRLGLGFGS